MNKPCAVVISQPAIYPTGVCAQMCLQYCLLQIVTAENEARTKYPLVENGMSFFGGKKDYTVFF